MSSRNFTKIALSLLALLVLGIGTGVTDRRLVKLREDFPLIRPDILHLPLAGIEPLIADIMWMRLIQFMGSGYSMTEQNVIEHVYRQVDTITRLDPAYELVYKYGILFLGFQAPGNAVEMTERAVRFIPEDELDWRIPFWGAFTAYQNLDCEKNLEICLKLLNYAVNAANAPSLVRRFRPLVLRQKQRFADALEIWLDIYQKSSEGDRSIIINQVKSTIADIYECDEKFQGKAKIIVQEWMDILEVDKEYFINYNNDD